MADDPRGSTQVENDFFNGSVAKIGSDRFLKSLFRKGREIEWNR